MSLTHTLITSIIAVTAFNPVAQSAASYWVISIIITCWDLQNKHVILSKSVVTLPHLWDSSSAALKLPPICSLNTANCISRSSHPPVDEMTQHICKALLCLLVFSSASSSSAQYSFCNMCAQFTCSTQGIWMILQMYSLSLIIHLYVVTQLRSDADFYTFLIWNIWN